MEAATLRETVNFSNNTKAVTPHSLGQVLSGYTTKEELEEAIENIPSSGSDGGAIIPQYMDIGYVNGFWTDTDEPLTLYKAGSVYHLRGRIKCPNINGTSAYVFKMYNSHTPLTNITHGEVVLRGTCVLESVNSLNNTTSYETLYYKMEGYHDPSEWTYYLKFIVTMPRQFYANQDYLCINMTWIQYDNTST